MPSPLPDLLYEAYTTREVRQQDGTVIPLSSNVHPEEAQRLYDVVREVEPEASVEIGLAQGVSAMAVAQAVADNGRGRHYVVDPLQYEWGYAGVANLERAGLADVVEFHEAYPEEVVPSFPRVGFGFIDGTHLFDLSMLDFVLIDKRLEVGGIIGFHDLWMPSLLKVLRYVLNNRHYEPYFDIPRLELTSTQRRHARVAGILRRLPGAERVLQPELLETTATLGLDANMVFIRKLGDDDRDWLDHEMF